MFLMFFMVFGIAIFGGGFIKNSILGIPYIYICMLSLFFSYFKYFFLKYKNLKLSIIEKSIIIFVLYGIIIVIFSFLEINKLFISPYLYTNKTYIFRKS